MAGGTRCVASQLNREGCAFGCLAEINGYFRFNVGPPRRPSAPASTAAAVKEATEDITKAAVSSLSTSPAEDVSEVEVCAVEV